MKLVTLGTSHGDPCLNRDNSSLLLRTGGGDYLFEAGAPVNALFIRKHIPFERLKAVFVSHSHEDHIGGLPGLLKSLVKRPKPGQFTHFFLPEEQCIEATKVFMDATHRPPPERLVDYSAIHAGTIYEDAELRVTAFPTGHFHNEGADFPSWAFAVDAGGRRYVFTGDLRSDLADFPAAAFDRPAVCIMECVHYPPHLAGPILRELPITRFIGVHIGNKWNGHPERYRKALGKVPFPVELAEDGNEYDLDAPPAPDFAIAVLADLHLQDDPKTLKDVIFDWAVAEIRRRGIPLTAGVGDLTGGGTAPAAKRLRRKLRALPGKFLLTPGNAELRHPPETDEVLKLHASGRDDRCLLLDTSRGRLSDAARILLADAVGAGKRDLLVLTHCPPERLPEADQALLAAAGKCGTVGLLVAGHLHRDRKYRWRGIPCELVRGLDPDKAIGDVPGFAVFRRTPDGVWSRKNVDYTPADIRKWSEPERRELLDLLGLSGMSDPEGSLEFARENQVGVVELRSSTLTPENHGKIAARLDAWREAGGKCLSLHFSDLKWQDDAIAGLPGLRAAADDARAFGADRITFHVPRLAVGAWRGDVPERFADAAAEILKPLTDAGVIVGIENLHMRPGEKADETRGFGYTPDEVREFADLLTDRGVPAGFHLDLGHAYNNKPYSDFYNISNYLAAWGRRINGCHLHQVAEGRNHQALTGWFERPIALSSLALAWRTGQIAHVPLILEIREGRGPESLFALRRAAEPKKK